MFIGQITFSVDRTHELLATAIPKAAHFAIKVDEGGGSSEGYIGLH
jgi:hypothetical protein